MRMGGRVSMEVAQESTIASEGRCGVRIVCIGPFPWPLQVRRLADRRNLLAFEVNPDCEPREQEPSSSHTSLLPVYGRVVRHGEDYAAPGQCSLADCAQKRQGAPDVQGPQAPGGGPPSPVRRAKPVCLCSDSICAVGGSECEVPPRAQQVVPQLEGHSWELRGWHRADVESGRLAERLGRKVLPLVRVWCPWALAQGRLPGFGPSLS